MTNNQGRLQEFKVSISKDFKTRIFVSHWPVACNRCESVIYNSFSAMYHSRLKLSHYCSHLEFSQGRQRRLLKNGRDVKSRLPSDLKFWWETAESCCVQGLCLLLQSNVQQYVMIHLNTHLASILVMTLANVTQLKNYSKY